MKIAIIGSGISGLTCASLLKDQHDIELFEAEDRLGGHTHTYEVSNDQDSWAVDTGFIVFNDRTYPNFERLLNKFGIKWQNTEMSFSVKNASATFEYNGHNLNTLFSQRSNIVSPRFYGFIREILRFNRLAKAHRNAALTSDQTLGAFVAQEGFSDFFAEHYLMPMVAAIWSCSLDDARHFPLSFFLDFFYNHGLLNIKDRPQWRVISGGSSSYIPALINGIEDRCHINTPVHKVTRHEDSVAIESRLGTQHYDQVIFACHSNQALRLLGDASAMEAQVLANMKYQSNDVILHQDAGIMPRHKRSWASWNFKLSDARDADQAPAKVTYYMNRLQGLDDAPDFFVSLNCKEQIDPQRIIQTFEYDHPVMDEAMIRSQAMHHLISGVQRTHFCGAYWFNGFHEDGVNSALRVCSELGVSL